MGVVFAAVVLGLMTCMGFLCGVLTMFSAVLVQRPQMAQYPILEGFQIGSGIFVLLVSGFCGWTVVALFRMKSWARVSIIVLGGLLAFFMFFSAALYVLLAFSSSGLVPDTPGASPAMIKGIFLGLTFFSLLVALVGVWWLVYFNLQRVRTLFAMSGRVGQREILSQDLVPAGGAWNGSTVPKRTMVEVLVICLGVLYLLGVISGIVNAFLQYPLFLLGFILRGVSVAVISLVFAAISLGLGIGLLRREKFAWLGALAFTGFGLVHALLMLLPRYQSRMADYQQTVFRSMQSGAIAAATDPMTKRIMGPMNLASVVVGVVMSGAIVWLLIRAKPLFELDKTS